LDGEDIENDIISDRNKNNLSNALLYFFFLCEQRDINDSGTISIADFEAIFEINFIHMNKVDRMVIF
jgi:hypothetical protein